MAGRVRHLLLRDGRYYARLVIPKELRRYLENKTELRKPLGPDRRTALRDLPAAVAELQAKIAKGEHAAARATGIVTTRYPLNAEQVAAENYRRRLAFDQELRLADPRYARIGYVDEELVRQLRLGMAGALADEELAQLVGDRIEKFRALGNTDVQPGTLAWRQMAITLCFSEYEALARVAERDDGIWTGTPAIPYLQAPLPEEVEPVSLRRLFEDYLADRARVGRGREAGKRWRPVIEDLIKFVGHDDAARLTKADLRSWRDARLKTLTPKTVSQVYLASVRTILNWAKVNDRLPENVAQDVRQAIPKPVRSREKGFTREEATAILAHARAYEPTPTDLIPSREYPETTAAKRWAPWLCAFSGARISEITQLRKEDFRWEGETCVMRITPDAGTVKTGEYRDVPLHPQIVALGFPDYLESCTGPLFFRASKGRDPVAASRSVADRIGKWLHGAELVPGGVSPNHGWRHCFKTVAREVGASERVIDAICGHAGRTAGEQYGDVSIKARKAAIAMLPSYDVT